MKLKFLTWLGAFLLTALGVSNTWANNTVTCTVGNVGQYNTATYSPYIPYSGNAGAQVASGALTFTVNCSRDAGGNTRSVTYTATTDNGLNESGTQNRAMNGASTLNYDFYTDSTCTTQWNGAAAFSTTFSTTASSGPFPFTHTFYACTLATPQTSVIVGDYVDTVTIQLSGTGTASQLTFVPVNATSAVKITVAKEFALTTPPGAIDFGTYTAFTGMAKTQNTSFVAKGTNQGTYTMALDNVNGVVAGLNYTLGLNATAGSAGSATLSATGTGASQTFYINGNMPGGQAGSCSGTACTATGASSIHTLTITY